MVQRSIQKDEVGDIRGELIGFISLQNDRILEPAFNNVDQNAHIPQATNFQAFNQQQCKY
jgi:hypothetical protein